MNIQGKGILYSRYCIAYDHTYLKRIKCANVTKLINIAGEDCRCCSNRCWEKCILVWQTGSMLVSCLTRLFPSWLLIVLELAVITGEFLADLAGTSRRGIGWGWWRVERWFSWTKNRNKPWVGIFTLILDHWHWTWLLYVPLSDLWETELRKESVRLTCSKTVGFTSLHSHGNHVFKDILSFKQEET